MSSGKVLDWLVDWEKSTKRFDNLHTGLVELLMEIGYNANNLRFILFFCIGTENRIYFFDSHNMGYRYLNADIPSGDDELIEDKLTKLFAADRSRSTVTYVRDSQEMAFPRGMVIHNIYGMLAEFQSPVESFFLETLVAHFCIDYTNKLPRGLFYVDKTHNQRIMHSALRRYLDIDMLSTLSGSLYEKRAPHGGILIADKTQQVFMKLVFESKYPFKIDNVRQVRKLLELTNDEMFLVVSKGNVVGLGTYDRSFRAVKFLGHQRWSFCVDNKEVLLYKQGRYTIPENTKKNFLLDFPAAFVAPCREYIPEILDNLTSQKQGALLIISDEAENEVNRLCSLERGYAINPIDMKLPANRELITNLASIDGAIFIDRKMICYGIGIILDGMALEKGLSSRGARFNSAKCYVDNKEPETYAAIVSSEDETVDIIYKAKE